MPKGCRPGGRACDAPWSATCDAVRSATCGAHAVRPVTLHGTVSATLPEVGGPYRPRAPQMGAPQRVPIAHSLNRPASVDPLGSLKLAPTATPGVRSSSPLPLRASPDSFMDPSPTELRQ